MTVLEVDEANWEACLGVANVLAEHNKINEALEIYRAVKENVPNSHQALVNQAQLHVERKNFEAAENLYKKALELFPGNRNLDIELYLSKVYFKKEDFDKCNKILNNLMIRYPTDIRLKLNMALCLLG